MIEYYIVTLVVADCPIQHQICCEGYTMFMGQCIGKIIQIAFITSSCFILFLLLASHVLPGLQDLINLGLIG
jgi:hypothetical protein